MNLYIRRMNHSDTASVKQFIDSAILHKSMLKVYEPSEMASWDKVYDSDTISGIIDSTHAYLLYDRDSGRPLASGYICLGEDGKTAHIGMIFSDFQFRNMGLGKRIIEALEQDEYAKKVDKIELESTLSAYKFYLRMGYSCKDDEYQIIENMGSFAVPMEKDKKDFGKI